MNISGVSSASASYNTNQAGSIEKRITELQKQLTEVQNDDSLDEKTKSQQITLYQTQISQLQAQLSKLKQDQTAGMQSYSESKMNLEQLAQEEETADTIANQATGEFGIGQYLNQEV